LSVKVALLTTGLTELWGLPRALTNLFPGHKFIAIEDRPNRPFHGFTSNRLPAPLAPVGIETSLDKLVAQGVSLVDPETAEPWELAVILDDLELANRTQPDVVCSEVRCAVERHLAGLERGPAAEQRLEDAVRTRLSFHLAVPMIESWFFAAPKALTDLGVSDKPFHMRPGDPEQFESTDRDYIAANPNACTLWCRHRRPKGDRPKWVSAGAERVRHPKGYLQWLLINPAHKTCTSYREGQHGAAPKLACIDWSSLLGTRNKMPFARSLVDDLAQGLGQAPAVNPWNGNKAPQTCRASPAASSSVLRNL